MTTHEDQLAEANETLAIALHHLDSAITESIFENGQLDIKDSKIDITPDGGIAGTVTVEGEVLPLRGTINATANEWTVTVGDTTVNFDAADILDELDEIDSAFSELEAITNGDYPDASYDTDDCEDDEE